MGYLIVYEILYSFGEQLTDSLLKRTPKFIRPPLVSILKEITCVLVSLLFLRVYTISDDTTFIVFFETS